MPLVWFGVKCFWNGQNATPKGLWQQGRFGVVSRIDVQTAGWRKMSQLAARRKHGIAGDWGPSALWFKPGHGGIRRGKEVAHCLLLRQTLSV